jgi:outer membrane protein OmpA-like peptidoglycan-associated protein
MVDRGAIQPGMEVLGTDGVVVGRVASLEAESLRLSPAADGRSHLIGLALVSRVDRQVHLGVTGSTIAGGARGGTVSTILPGAAAATGAGAAPSSASAAPRPAATAAPSAAPADDSHASPLPPVRNPAVENSRPRGNYYLPWFLGGLLLLLLLFALLRSCDTNDEGVRSTAAGTQAVDRSDAANRAGPGRYAEGSIAYELDRFLGSGAPPPRTLVFDKLNFETGSAALRAEDVGDLDQIAQVMNAYPQARIAVIGYTDARGGGRANARLGEERARAVVDGLAVRGIERSRMEGRSGGEQEPVADNRRAEGQAENRRTELIVLSR